MTFAYINPMGKYLAVYFFSTYNKLHAKVVLVYDIREEYLIWNWRFLQCRDRPYISGTESLMDDFLKQKYQILENILWLIVWFLELDDIFKSFLYESIS